jgi:NADPH-dependent 2,4-dienoyl-CoA reductase/sulfur reductase-like enzyme
MWYLFTSLWRPGLHILHGSAKAVNYAGQRCAFRLARTPQQTSGKGSEMGKTTHAKVVIVGSGPAGYTAAI